MFCETWEARYRVEYQFAEGKDGAHVKWILDAVERDAVEASKIVRAYLACNEPWLIERRHPLGILRSQFNKHRVLPPPKGGGAYVIPPSNRRLRRGQEETASSRAEDLPLAGAAADAGTRGSS